MISCCWKPKRANVENNPQRNLIREKISNCVPHKTRAYREEISLEDSTEKAALDSELRGNTLRVYWFMLTQHASVGVREVQRALGMSSPSVASHHLTKLASLELVEQRPDNSYEVSRVVKVGVLRNFIGFRGRFLPRYMFVAIFFTVYIAAYFILSFFSYPGLYDRYIAMGVGAIGAGFAWLESIRLWKLKLS
jgi:hypothetical protein